MKSSREDRHLHHIPAEAFFADSAALLLGLKTWEAVANFPVMWELDERFSNG